MIGLFFSLFTLALSATEYPVFDTWEVPEEFIWDLGLAAKCDVGLNPNPMEYGKYWWHFHLNPKDFDHLQSGDRVWMKPDSVSQFCREILPKVQVPIVLVISGTDLSFPSESINDQELNSLISNANITHIFAVNNDYEGPSDKFSPIPIGIDFHSLAYVDRERDQRYNLTVRSPGEQALYLQEIISTLQPTYARKKRAFVDFQHSDTLGEGHLKRYLKTQEDRKTIFSRLKETNLIDYGPKISRDSLWKTKGEYAFSISPHGNGLDCIRTWEDLALGCIVIVKTSPLDPLYTGLPVVIVKDWDEVTEQNLNQWLAQYGDAFTNPEYREKITHRYWMNQIKKN